MRILLVEDDRTIAAGLCYSLQAEGYQVEHCATCAGALEQVEAGGWDLLLLDLTLPDGSGYDICRWAKALGDTPVVFLTACD